MRDRRSDIAASTDIDAFPATGPPPRTEHRTFRGASGLRDLPPDGTFGSTDPEGFEAEMTRVRLGRLVLRRTRMSAHHGMVDGRDGADDPDVLRLLTVQEGALLAVAPGGQPSRLGVGDAMFTCRARSYAYRTEGPIVLVSSTMPVSSLPAAVRRLDHLPIGPLPHTALVDAVIELMASLAGRLEESWTFDSAYAARGLIDLETAILTEVLGPQEPLVGTDRIHAAAVEYIEHHLADADLRPPQIADALGVSLRYLHRAFDDKEVTVARHLRERRLDLVAEALRAAPRRPSLATLAERYGFSSQDGLARAFRRRYGRSMTDFRAALDD